MWDILESLLQNTPIISVNIPDASVLPVRCVAWMSLLEDNILFYSNTEGNINLIDLKDPFIFAKIFRVRCKAKDDKVFVLVRDSFFCFDRYIYLSGRDRS